MARVVHHLRDDFAVASEPARFPTGLMAKKFNNTGFAGSCGKGVICCRNMVIRHGHKNHIGDNVAFDAKSSVNQGIITGERSSLPEQW
jgi:hypothetical protein